MKVHLSDLKDNPCRDFAVDPIDEENVNALIQSIKDDGFWGGVVCRKTKTGLEIAAGHTRVRAALKSGIESADLFVGQKISDAEMIRIYTRENATQRGNTTRAMAGSVISAVKYLARTILGDEPSQNWDGSRNALELARTNLVSGDGIGEKLIEKLFEGIPRIKGWMIRDQLATLKASGDYQRAILEVTAEVEADPDASIEAKERASKAAAHVKGAEKEFDFAGVAKHMQNEAQIRAFREEVTKPGIKEILPINKQADLAKHLVKKSEEDSKTDKTAEFSARYIRENTGILARDAKDYQRKLSREEQASKERANSEEKFNRLANDFCLHARGLQDSGKKLIAFIDASDFGFRMPETMKSAIKYATQILNELTRAL